MKIRCNEIIDKYSGALKESSPWITRGKNYDVVTIHVSKKDGTVDYRIINNQGSLGIHRSNQFTIIDGHLPFDDLHFEEDDEHIWIGPQALLEVGFWERYYDGDELAQKAVEDTLGRAGLRLTEI